MLPVDININANNLFSLDVAVYFFLTFLGILIAVSVFMMFAFCCLKEKKIAFYAWEIEQEGEPFKESEEDRLSC